MKRLIACLMSLLLSGCYLYGFDSLTNKSSEDDGDINPIYLTISLVDEQAEPACLVVEDLPGGLSFFEVCFYQSYYESDASVSAFVVGESAAIVDTACDGLSIDGNGLFYDGDFEFDYFEFDELLYGSLGESLDFPLLNNDPFLISVFFADYSVEYWVQFR